MLCISRRSLLFFWVLAVPSSVLGSRMGNGRESGWAWRGFWKEEGGQRGAERGRAVRCRCHGAAIYGAQQGKRTGGEEFEKERDRWAGAGVPGAPVAGRWEADGSGVEVWKAWSGAGYRSEGREGRGRPDARRGFGEGRRKGGGCPRAHGGRAG
ncbi:hypothetical protein PVAP13_3NG249527 [Panicum virgatum]|uniref:Uncharacterized protein n=1 Tax=Panicum virgatum TaxID=38727 RepID=A0A8T0U7H3_PANVG|nr:hypothetical protein PVAP13_3NG249527 [Panicum virgatum]